MSRLAWLSVADWPTTTKDIVFTVPDDQDWLSLLRGALVPLTYAENYEQFGALTPDQMADYWRTLILPFFEEIPMIPSGFIMPYAGQVTPDGWLVCDGAAVLQSAYPALFTAIEFAFGLPQNADTHFLLPNLKGKVVAGIDGADSDYESLGHLAGAKTVTLSTTQIPSHNHTQNSHNHTQNSHFHTIPRSTQAFIASGSNLGMPGYVGGAFTTPASNETNAQTPTNIAATATNQTTGGGGSHSNIQPSIALNYLIKT